MNKIITKKKVNFSDYYLVVTLFYFLLKFTRVAEFGVDLPAIIFSILAIYYFIKFYESDQNFEKEELFYLNLIFSVFSILIKLSTIPIILLTIYLYIKNFRILKLRIFNYKFLIIYLLCLIFLLNNLFTQGVYFFPQISPA